MSRVAIVSVSIRRGSCGGEVVYTGEVSRTSAPASDPPVLEDGSWAFSARASDSVCRLVAEGCVVVELPADGPVRVEMEAVSSAPLCDESVCRAGRCGGSGDGGVRDGGEPDASLDAGTPCGTDFCTQCEACEMNRCVARSDGFVCAEGGGRCVAGSCCTGCIDLMGTCQDGTEHDVCGIGGASCIACGACEPCSEGMCKLPDGGTGGLCDGGT